MAKFVLNLTETVKYSREIEIEMSDELTEDDLEVILEDIERGYIYTFDDYANELTQRDIKVIDYDDSYDSPTDVEIECDDYEIKED